MLAENMFWESGKVVLQSVHFENISSDSEGDVPASDFIAFLINCSVRRWPY